jgi:hypothetical protein
LRSPLFVVPAIFDNHLAIDADDPARIARLSG